MRPSIALRTPKSPLPRGQDRLGTRALGKPLKRAPRLQGRTSVEPVRNSRVFDDFLPYVVLKLAHQLTSDLVSEFKKHGVNLVRWRILAALAMADGSTISQICELAMMQQSALSRMLMVMETEKYLTRRLRRGDERWVEIYLTPKGRKLFEALNAIVRARQGRILNGLSPEEIAAGFDFVRRVSANVEAKALQVTATSSD